MAEHRDATSPGAGPANFINIFSKVRVIAEAVLDGPRSVILTEHSSTGVEEWITPVLRMSRRIMSPLSAETKSLFSLIKAPSEGVFRGFLAIRSCRWSGRDDKQRCMIDQISFPAVSFEYSAIPLDRAWALDATLRALDEGLAHVPFSTEGLGMERQAEIPSGEFQAMIYPCSYMLRVWRSVQFQEIESRWYEDDANCAELTRVFRETWARLEELDELSAPMPNANDSECYEPGRNPTDLMRWLFHE